MDDKAIRLDIGSGDKPHEGFTGVDLYSTAKGIVQAPMDKLPFEDEMVDEIFSSHALEHIGKYEVIPTLKEWRRVLKFDARLTIEVPDLEWVCKNWLKYKSVDWNMDAIFGDQSTPGQFHKTGFTRQILCFYLEQAGFQGRSVDLATAWSHEQDCIIATLTK